MGKILCELQYWEWPLGVNGAKCEEVLYPALNRLIQLMFGCFDVVAKKLFLCLVKYSCSASEHHLLVPPSSVPHREQANPPRLSSE